jgi:hypothetical protein
VGEISRWFSTCQKEGEGELLKIQVGRMELHYLPGLWKLLFSSAVLRRLQLCSQLCRALQAAKKSVWDWRCDSSTHGPRRWQLGREVEPQIQSEQDWVNRAPHVNTCIDGVLRDSCRKPEQRGLPEGYLNIPPTLQCWPQSVCGSCFWEWALGMASWEEKEEIKGRTQRGSIAFTLPPAQCHTCI